MSIGKLLENVRNCAPLVHNITNYVTANDVANVLLAIGASPIMADDEREVGEITSLCAGLCLNIGTLNSRTIPSMKLSGKIAKESGKVIVLDPVGAGASRLRTETALELLQSVKPTVIRGNMSEIRCLAEGIGGANGVDARAEDAITEENLEASVSFAQRFSKNTGAIVAITGKIDLVTDGEKTILIRNGRKEMGKVTGTGCQLSSLIVAFLAANPEEKLLATASALSTMGLAGEMAFQENQGNSSYRTAIIDRIYLMDSETLEKGAKYEYFSK